MKREEKRTPKIQKKKPKGPFGFPVEKGPLNREEKRASSPIANAVCVRGGEGRAWMSECTCRLCVCVCVSTSARATIEAKETYDRVKRDQLYATPRTHSHTRKIYMFIYIYTERGRERERERETAGEPTSTGATPVGISVEADASHTCKSVKRDLREA